MENSNSNSNSLLRSSFLSYLWPLPRDDVFVPEPRGQRSDHKVNNIILGRD
jgi:hypothetical protein